MELSEWLVKHDTFVKQEIDLDSPPPYFEFVTTDYELSPSEAIEHRKKTLQGPRVCVECGKSFSRADSLKRHEKLYCRVKSAVKCCRFCGQQFVKPQSLRQHISAIHSAELKEEAKELKIKEEPKT